MNTTWQTMSLQVAPPGWKVYLEDVDEGQETVIDLVAWLVQEEMIGVGIQAEGDPKPTGKTRVVAGVEFYGETVPFYEITEQTLVKIEPPPLFEFGKLDQLSPPEPLSKGVVEEKEKPELKSKSKKQKS